MHFFRLTFGPTGEPSIQRSRGQITISRSTTPVYGDLQDDDPTQGDDEMESPMDLEHSINDALRTLRVQSTVWEFWIGENGVHFFVGAGDNSDLSELQDRILDVLNANQAQLAA